MTAAARAPGLHLGRRRALRAGLVALVVALSAVVLFVLVHRIPWLGPALADGLRRIVGAHAVTRLEESAYGIEDRWHRLWRSDEEPTAYWPVPSAEAPDATASGALPAALDASAPIRFRPRDVGPFDARMRAAGDGIWVAVPDPGRPDLPLVLYKTLIHPDRQRPWAVVFVVALDASRIDLRVMAGSVDPEATLAEGRAASRPARVPDNEQPRLLAAFNGGFKTEHGHYGMRVGGITLIPARPDACTIARYDDGSLGIGTWSEIGDTAQRMQWWRQAPPCMVERGQVHPGLREDGTTRWGAALGGETTIRRSAIGIDAPGATLFVAVSDYTTAGALARAMRHVGGHAVAQLDVNWSFPKFVVYRAANGAPVADGLFPGFVFEADEYVGRRSPRDFFYVLRR